MFLGRPLADFQRAASPSVRYSLGHLHRIVISTDEISQCLGFASKVGIILLRRIAPVQALCALAVQLVAKASHKRLPNIRISGCGALV